MYNVGAKLPNGTESKYANKLTCVREKGDESECFRIDNSVKQGCIMSPWLFHMYMDAVMKEVKIGIEGWEEALFMPVLLYGSETVWRRGLRLGLYRWTSSDFF